MRFELKPLSREAIAGAMVRAVEFRLLNEPQEAESICRDILRTDSEHQEALKTLLLSLADQFEEGSSLHFNQARKLLPLLHDEYTRLYCGGVIFERWAKAHHAHGQPGTVAYEWYLEAMRAFEQAEAIRPPGNDDARLRWNSCVRRIHADEYMRHKFGRLSAGDEATP